eukprot:403348173
MTEQDLQIRGASAVNQICTQKFSETKKNDFQLSQNRNQKIEDFLSILTEKITIINHSKIEAYGLTSLETQQKYLDDQTKDKDIQVQSETQQHGISNLANLKSSIFGNKVLKKRLWVQKEQNNKENFPQPFCLKNKFQNLIKSRPQNNPEPPLIKIPKIEPSNFNLIMKQLNILNKKDSQNVRVIPQQDVIPLIRFAKISRDNRQIPMKMDLIGIIKLSTKNPYQQKGYKIPQFTNNDEQ